MNKSTELRCLIDHYASDIFSGYASLIQDDKRRYALQVIESADRIKELAQEYYTLAVKAAEQGKPG